MYNHTKQHLITLVSCTCELTFQQIADIKQQLTKFTCTITCYNAEISLGFTMHQLY